MKILRVTFYRDFDFIKKFLSKSEFFTYRVKSKIILNMLKNTFNKDEVTEFFSKKKDGFYVEIKKETDNEILEQKKALENFFLNINPPESYAKITDERFFKLIKNKIKKFNKKLFEKVMSERNMISILNIAGILVKWKLI